MIGALATTLFFACNAIFANRSAQRLGSNQANLARLTLATLLLGIWAHAVGQGLGGSSLRWFLLSGLAGFGLGGVAMFQALPRIGSPLAMLIVQCGSSVVAAAVEWGWLGTRLTPMQAVFVGVTLAGVALGLMAPMLNAHELAGGPKVGTPLRGVRENQNIPPGGRLGEPSLPSAPERPAADVHVACVQPVGTPLRGVRENPGDVPSGQLGSPAGEDAGGRDGSPACAKTAGGAPSRPDPEPLELLRTPRRGVPTSDSTGPRSIGHGSLRVGITWAGISALGQGLGAVLSRKAFRTAALAHETIDAATTAYQRALGGLLVAALVVMLVWMLRASAPPPPARTSGRAWPWVVANAIAGPVLGVTCFQWALSTTPAGIVQPIVATAPLLTIPLAMWLEGARPRPLYYAGTVLAVAGVIGLFAFR